MSHLVVQLLVHLLNERLNVIVMGNLTNSDAVQTALIVLGYDGDRKSLHELWE